jgi:hypothetical protein
MKTHLYTIKIGSLNYKIEGLLKQIEKHQRIILLITDIFFTVKNVFSQPMKIQDIQAIKSLLATPKKTIIPTEVLTEMLWAQH